MKLALHVLSYVDDFHELVRGVGWACKYWRRLSSEDCLWRRMCERWEFEIPLCLQDSDGVAVPGSAKRDFKIQYLQRKSAVLIFSFFPALILACARNELDSGRNPAPHPPTTDPATRGGSGDVPCDGRRLDRRRAVGQQDPRLQFSNGRVESDVGWVSGRGLGHLVGRERVLVVTFAEEEEYQFGICWVGAGDFVGCEWRVR